MGCKSFFAQRFGGRNLHLVEISSASGHRFGTEVEGAFRKWKAPPPPGRGAWKLLTSLIPPLSTSHQGTEVCTFGGRSVPWWPRGGRVPTAEGGFSSGPPVAWTQPQTPRDSFRLSLGKNLDQPNRGLDSVSNTLKIRLSN